MLKMKTAAKVLLFSATLLFFSFHIRAQQKNIFKEEFRKEQALPDTSESKKTEQADTSRQKIIRPADSMSVKKTAVPKQDSLGTRATGWSWGAADPSQDTLIE